MLDFGNVAMLRRSLVEQVDRAEKAEAALITYGGPVIRLHEELKGKYEELQLDYEDVTEEYAAAIEEIERLEKTYVELVATFSRGLAAAEKLASEAKKDCDEWRIRALEAERDRDEAKRAHEETRDRMYRIQARLPDGFGV